MNNFFTKIGVAFAGIAMAVGVGVAVGAKKESTKAEAADEIYEKYTASSMTAGSYVLVDDGIAMKNTLTSGRFTNQSVTISNNKITNPAASIVWEIAASGDYWTLYNSSVSKYAKIGTGTSSSALVDAEEDGALFSVTISSATYDFYNKLSSTRYLRRNTTYGFSSYSGTTGSALTLYKKASSAQTYTVHFNGNGAKSGSMSDVTDATSPYELPANIGFTAPDNKAFAGWKKGNEGDLIAPGSTCVITGETTFYAQWVNAYTVTYSAGTHGTGSYAHASQPTGNYTLLPFASLTGVSASTGYTFKDYTVGGVSKNPGDTITLSAATPVTVNFEEKSITVTYDFTNNWSTYADKWAGYAAHTVTGTDVGAEYEALISFDQASKQSGSSSNIKDRPVINAKTGLTSTMSFVLDSSVSASYKITTVSIEFKQWGTKTVNYALYKGTTVSGDALDSGTVGTKNTLTTSNLNGDSFIVNFTKDSNNNTQLGVTSIEIGLKVKSAFGTLDHIKVTSKPNLTIYHNGEYFDPTGLRVTAYDALDEGSANYKDVTDLVEVELDDTYQFDESDVPGFDTEVSYTESEVTKTDSYHIDVYALAEYELVTAEPADWSGSYLLVASYTDSKSVSHKVAINSALVNFDQPLNFKEVSISNNKITTGQELEWSFAAYSSGYSMKGKNNKYAFGNSSNRFMTSDSAQELTLSFSSNIVTVTGAASYILRMNSSTVGAERFGFYNSGSADISFYKLKASDNADLYAQSFLERLSTGESHVCQYNKQTGEVTTDLAALRTAWKELAQSYASGFGLTPAEKEQFRIGIPSEDPNASNIAKALALYDHIARAYGTQLHSEGFTNYDFMNRGIVSSHSNIVLGNSIVESNATMIIVVISLVSLTAVGGYFLLKKKKEQ